MIFFTGFLYDLLVISTTMLVVIISYYKWKYNYWKRRNIPYIEPSIPFGNFDNPFGKNQSFGKILTRHYRNAKEKGWKKHCGIFMLATPMYLVLDLDLVKNVLTRDFSYFTDRTTYVNEKDDPLSCHLFSIGGTKWKNLRPKLSPTFTSGKMKAMFQTLVDCGLILEKHIEEEIKPNMAVDIKDILGKFTMDVIGSCAFGLDCNSFLDPNSLFRFHGKKIVDHLKFELIKIFFCLDFPNFARSLGLRLNPKDSSDFFIKVVEDTVAYREKNNVTRKDFLQLLIDIKSGNEAEDNEHKGNATSLTLLEMAAQCAIFFIAGFEPTSTMMTFALFNLATHPEIQEKVREEIHMVLGKHSGQMTYNSINELTYMRQVIDETLRMYPPFPILSRKCVMDYPVPGENVTIEEGTSVMIPIVAIHDDEEYYPDPRKFDPERFNEENKKKRQPYVYLPFGDGPRNCIGERFVIFQAKVGLTSVLRKFKITLNEKTKIPFKFSASSLITTVDDGIWFNIERIEM